MITFDPPLATGLAVLGLAQIRLMEAGLDLRLPGFAAPPRWPEPLGDTAAHARLTGPSLGLGLRSSAVVRQRSCRSGEGSESCHLVHLMLAVAGIAYCETCIPMVWWRVH